MMKYRVVFFLATTAVGIGLATAQNSQGRSSSAKSGKDPLQAATKPLTPKSAMEPRRKSSVAVPHASKSGPNTTAELTHLERQSPIKTKNPNSTPPPKAAALPKTIDQSAGNGSRTNFKYRKPVGGLKATTPKANSPNSTTPRVTKSN
ncbi:MAG TPA: hypothetical protein VNX26_07320 [Candidatus Acidoferrum sp.]|jgi:hypothetical protein|nr:hypothetical protein [Candidatus Acidoferrum sp.]